MTNEFKGRYADYCTGVRANNVVERKVRLSLNQVKANFGRDIARAVLQKKELVFGNNHWLELVLMPGEKNAKETAVADLKKDVVHALYLDLRESYPSLPYNWLMEEADRLLAGGEPIGGPSMFLDEYLLKTGLLKEG